MKTLIDNYGETDHRHDTLLTVIEGGEHWFHTDEQIQFLDDWIRRKEKEWT